MSDSEATLELYQFRTSRQQPNLSPYCVKVEFYLKLNNIPYTSKIGDPRKGPKKKLPYIISEGEMVCDSEHIIQYLNNKFAIDIDKNFSPEEKAVIYGMKKSIDEYLIMILVYSRFVDEQGWRVTEPSLFGSLPWPMSKVVGLMVRNYVKKMLYAQGLNRHSHEEIEKFAEEGLAHLSTFLGQKKYFMGDQLSSLDLSAFGLLANVFEEKTNTFYKKLALKHGNLIKYVGGITSQFYKK